MLEVHIVHLTDIGVECDPKWTQLHNCNGGYHCNFWKSLKKIHGHHKLWRIANIDRRDKWKAYSYILCWWVLVSWDKFSSDWVIQENQKVLWLKWVSSESNSKENLVSWFKKGVWWWLRCWRQSCMWNVEINLFREIWLGKIISVDRCIR